jgi:hypothetical protein
MNGFTAMFLRLDPDNPVAPGSVGESFYRRLQMAATVHLPSATSFATGTFSASA